MPSITLTWNANPATDNILDYEVWGANGTSVVFGSCTLLATVSALTWTDAGLPVGQARTYYIRAANSVGESSLEGPLNITAASAVSTYVQNLGGAPSMKEGTHAGRPAAGNTGAVYIETDTKTVWRDNGATWDGIGSASGSYFASVKDYGAVGDGTTDDTTAFTAAAAAAVSLVVPPGTYKLTGNVTFADQVTFLNGASIVSSAAITVAFNGGLNAPPAKIFTLTGSAAVTLSPITQTVAFAEWWGATPYAGSTYPVGSPTYSDVQIQAAVNSGAPLVQLMAADYYIANAINLLNSLFTLQGMTGGDQSRLVMKSATIDGICIGPASQPGSATPDYVYVRHLGIRRTVAPTSINGNVPGSPTGLRLRWAANCYIEDVLSIDSSNGFYTTGTFSCHYRDCYALRLLATNGSGWDYWQGFSQDNNPNIGTVSGNASLYYTYNVANNSAGSFPGGTWGLRAYGGFSDSFVQGVETSNCQTGLEFDGLGTSGTAYTGQDLKISSCVIDQAGAYGIRVYSADQEAAALISDCYVSLHAGVGISIDSFGGGGSSVLGNQVLGTAGGCTGISIANAVGASSVSNLITDCAIGVEFNNSNNCRCQDTITSTLVTATAAVWLTGTSSINVVQPIVNGLSSGISGLGIKVDSGATFNSVDPSGINPAGLTGAAAANKVVYNGTQITTPGPFGTNNVLVGYVAAPVAPGTVTGLSAPLGGGTSGVVGTASFTNHGVLIGQGAAVVVATAAGSPGQVLTSNGGSADPTYQAAPTGNTWLPVVDGHEAPAFITDGAGHLITVAYVP